MKQPPFLIFAGLLFLFACNKTPKVAIDYSALKSPISSATIDFQASEIDVTKPNVISLQGGGSLEIPADAFVDANGNKITGKAKIEYRQFDDAADIIASGIPMTTKDESGNPQTLESGGMFEIQGFADGKPIFVADGKSMTVNLASPMEGDFDFYLLEPEKETAGQFQWKKLSGDVDGKAGMQKFPFKDSFALQFDTAAAPETKLLNGLQLHTAYDDACWNANKSEDQWPLNEKWTELHISQPQKLIRPLKELGAMSVVGSSDANSKSETFTTYNKDATQLYDWQGKQLKKLAPPHEGSSSYIQNLSKNKHFFVWHGVTQLVAYNEKGSKIGEAQGYSFYTNICESKNRVIIKEYELGENYGKSIDLTILDLNLKPIKTIELPFFEKGYSSQKRSVKITKDSNYIVTLSKRGVEVFDLNGKLQATLASDFEQTHTVPSSDDEKMIFIYRANGQIDAWNWKTNKLVSSPKDLYPIDYSFYNSWKYDLFWTNALPFAPIPVDAINFKAWDWKNNKIVEFPGHYTFIYRLEDSDLFAGDGTSNHIFNLQGQKITETTYSKIRHVIPSLVNSPKGKGFLVGNVEKVFVMDTKGSSMIEFGDTSIISILFDDKRQQFLSYSSSGLCIWWDIEGKRLSSFNVAAQMEHLELSPKDYIALQDDLFSIWREYDLQGNLLLEFGKGYCKGENGDTYLVTDQGSLSLVDISGEISDSNIYQITLYNKEKTFRTYTYLDSKGKRKIRKYCRNRDKRLRKEVEETKQLEEQKQSFVRSLKITGFGIYNWDRFFKDDQQIPCALASNLAENVPVFLITGENRNAVVEYGPGTISSFDKFSFNPNMYNQLIAILPDDKIGVVTNETFQSLDLEKIRKEGKYHFQFDTKDITSLDVLKTLTASTF